MSKKIYIPTTTLNFDNILSSESISPKSFYSNRRFGFSRWFNVDENNNDDVILLYDTPMGFFRPKSDIEDHPLLIEITVNETVNSLFERVDDGVYSYAKTIYIDPWNTYFIFQNERDKQTTLSLSDSSLETKVTRLYSKRMIVKQFSGQYKPSRELIDHELNTSAIKYDIATNKFKGFLYGYYVGAILSTSKSDVHQLILLKELRNVIAAIISNINGQPSPYQAQMVMSLTSDLNNYNQHRDALRQLISSDKEYSNVVKYLTDNELIRDVFDGNSILQSLNSFDVNKNSSIRTVEFVNQTIDAFENKIEKKRSLLLPDCGEAIISDQRLIAINNNSFNSDIEKNIYFMWINEIFISSEYNGKISYYREALTDNLTVKAKNLLHEQWDSSEIKVAMNKLRRHLRGEEFDIKWNNGLISSLAAVITNGGDWGKMLSFMQQKGMNDYRLAFSMYGMLIGFANLTRDFTDIILNCDNKYVADVYKEFYGQLFDVSVNIERNDNITIDDKCNYGTKDAASQIPKSEDDKLLDVLKNANVVKRQSKNLSKDDIYNNIMNIYIKHNRKWGSAFQDMIDDKSNGITSAVIDGICCCLELPNWKKSKCKDILKFNKVKEISSPSLFSTEEDNLPNISSVSLSSKLIWEDDELWSYIQSEFDEKNRKQAYEDVIWFQKEFQKGDQSTYYSKARRDNNSAVITFEKYLGNFEKKRYMNEQTLRNIMVKIKSKYK